MIDLSHWRASIGSWNFCQRPTRSNHSCSIRSANGCRCHLFSTTAEKKEMKLLKTAAFLIVFELVFLVLFLKFSIHILLHYSPVRLTGIVGGYSSFQYTVISAENWLQLEPICFYDNLLLLLLSGDVELNPGPTLDPDILKKEPMLLDLLKIFDGCEHRYKMIGHSLDVIVTDIRYDAAAPKNSLRLVFQRWRDKNEDVNWERIMQVCEDFPDDFGKVQSTLEEYLSSEKAREKYLENHKGSSAPQSLDITNLHEIWILLSNGLFNGHWEELGLQLGLYDPTLSNIQANYPRDNDRCLLECIARWLQRADGVDSKGGANYVTLAEALEKMDQKHTANYIRGSTIDKWLKEGSVELTVTRVTMCGLPGTGKTCAQNLLLNKEALSDDSTQIADRTVRATRVSYDNNNWDEVTRKEMLGRLKADLLQKDSNLQVSVTTSQQNAPTSTSENTSDESDDDATDGNDINDDKTVITELLQTDSVKGFQKKEDWLYIIDSGGQPAYQELLPLFTRAASLNIITIDLSKPLDEELELEYRIDGKSYPCHSKSTQLACFESAISSGAIFEPLIIPGVTDTDPEAKQSRSMHIILGTHYNDDDKKVGDKVCCLYEERLSKFVSSLESYLRERIIKTPESMVFHVNSLAESSRRKEYREKVCKAIWDCGADASCKFKLPIRWFAFELSLPESCVITEKEAISIGGKYEMGKEDTKLALRYLHHVSLVLYYPNVALVFTSPQPILKILSQLLALTYQYDDGKTPNLTNERISLVDKEDLQKGFLKKNLLEILKESSEVFSEQHFKSSHLIDILCQLNIIHPEQDGSYFIPYALPSFKTSDQKFKKEPSFPKPLCILYWTEEGRENQNLPIPQGVFPLAIVYLLNQEKVKIPQPKNRFYMCRDAMTLLYGRNILHMINHYSHIEVHYIGPKEDCSDIRKLVFEAITDGSTKINCKRDYIYLGFTCEHNEIIIIDKKGNRKTPCSSTELSCSLDDDTYKCWFNENATSPGVAQSSTSDIKDNDSQKHKRSTTKRLASVRNIENETVNEETNNYPHPKRSCNISDITKKEPKDVDLFVAFRNYENQYTLIGSGLDVNVNGIKYDPGNPTECLRLVFGRWREKNRNVTWEKIEQICKKFPDRLGKVHSNLQKYLSSDDA